MSATAPENFKVKFTTSKGPVVIEVHKAWAPKGAQRFYELVRTDIMTATAFSASCRISSCNSACRAIRR